MPISQTDSLFQLIKSLTKGEKRNFRLYAKRNHNAESLKFIDLFDIFDKQTEGNDDVIFSKLKGVTKVQYSNLKRHLYSQIITSLRIIHKAKRANIQVREYVDFAYILYGKGLFLQALKILQMAKRDATKHHLNLLILTIVEFEKLIETRHITRSGEDKAQLLVEESTRLTNTISDAVYLSNLRAELHTMYLKDGHSQSDKDREMLKKYFNEKTRAVSGKSLGVMEQIYLYQSHVWFNYIQMDFESCREYAERWVQLLKDNPEMIQRDVDLFMRGYHYVLTATYHLKDVESMTKNLAELEKFRYASYKKLNSNSQIISFLYVHTGRLNNVIIRGNFEEGLDLIPRTTRRINKYRLKLDDHRVLMFYFKIAWIYFGAGKVDRAIFYLNKIVNKDMLHLRNDLQFYSRLMFLMCHYELENFDTMTYLLKSFQPFFNRLKGSSTTELQLINLFKLLAKKPPHEHREIMTNAIGELDLLRKDPFLKNAFVYLDVISWLKSKVTRLSLSEVVADLL